MPFNGTGQYTFPSNTWNPAVAGTTINPADWNADVIDLQTALSSLITVDGQSTTTNRIPFAAGMQTDSITEITAGGGVTIGKVNLSLGADIASAATINLTTATGQCVDVTGVIGITAVTLGQGSWRLVRFTGILTLTHGASLVLPGAANITTAAGDYALFVGYASSVVRCAYYQPNVSPITTAVIAASTFGTDNSILRSDGTSRGAQSSGATATIDDSGNPTFTSTDAGAAAAPVETLDRNSASPAAADVLGSWVASGRNSAAATKTYASAQAEIIDATSTSEDGIWNWQTIIAGTLASRLKLGAGLYTTGVTGGDQGVGTINAAGIYVAGVAVGALTINIQTFVAAGAATYTPTSGMKYAIIFATGGGGGGGAGTNSATAGGGGGGGAGGTAIGVFSAATIGASKGLVIGAAGAAVGAGGNTTFGTTLLQGNGGGAGATESGASPGAGGAGGTAPTGTFLLIGGDGNPGQTGNTVEGSGGNGGGSMWGSGGKGGATISGNNSPGTAGRAYGAGGGGASGQTNSPGGGTGGAGAAGAILVIEFI